MIVRIDSLEAIKLLSTGKSVWKIDMLNPAGLSHISLWVRDPAAVNDIPEPATLALLGLGLLGICLAGRRQA